MNKKGFSLIELLAVIVILGLILVIAVPNVVKMVDDFRKKDRIEMLKKSAISAVKEYIVDGNLSASSVSCNDSETFEVSIEVDTLISAKYLDDDEYYSGKTISVTYDCVNKKFTNYVFN